MHVRQTRLGPLDCAVVQGDAAPPRLGVVLCHGFGAPGTDLVGLAEELMQLHPRLALGVCFVFPEAPLSLAAHGYGPGRAWWMIDVGRFMAAQRQGPSAIRQLEEEVPKGLKEARRALSLSLEALAQSTGLPPRQWVLGGFSQGAMLATDWTLRAEEAPAALVLFSGALMCKGEWQRLAARRQGLSVLQSHGQEDPILPFLAGEDAQALLSEAGLNVDFIPFQGGHTIPVAALERFADLLDGLLGQTPLAADRRRV